MAVILITNYLLALFGCLQWRAELVELLLRPLENRIPALLARVLCGVNDYCCARLRLRVRRLRVGLPRRRLGDTRARAKSYGGCNRIPCRCATQGVLMVTTERATFALRTWR